MKNLCVTPILLIVYCCLVGSTTAQTSQSKGLTDGNSLLASCEKAVNPKSDSDMIDAVRLMGFIDGFTCGLYYESGLHKEDGPFGMPANISMGQKIRIIKKWLEDNPRALNGDYMSSIFLSLRAAFPPKDRESLVQRGN